MIIDGWDFGSGQLMRPHEVAEVFRVHVRTVSRWALVGNLSCIRTPGDERRFSREQVEYVKNGGAWGPRNGRTVDRGGEGTA
ncbi:excisionase family DNA-binding protein [Actinomadura syzygii]|nr:excisionase family DNA-binding protein [Actinomadura syzygii]